jgi:hypothetical protein
LIYQVEVLVVILNNIMKGEVVAFIGAPGVGTSFLTRQMACRNCNPSFLEGEEGIFTSTILSVLNNKIDTPQRYDWLAERTRLMLERAHAIAGIGITSYVDGDILLLEAWLNAEIGKQSPPILRKWIKANSHLRADKVIVLTAPGQKIQENITRRGRISEQSDFIQQRAQRIGQECRKLEGKHEHVRILDRNNLEFTKTETLDLVDNLIKQIPSLIYAKKY